MALRGRFALLDEWCGYVTENHRHPVTRDEWAMLLEFSLQVDKDLANYDEDGAWLGQTGRGRDVPCAGNSIGLRFKRIRGGTG